jgi:transcriptional regulator of acetoin/glycerol metabolism
VGLILGALLRRQRDLPAVSLTAAAGVLLFRHSWPLNIRELERYLTTALVLAQGAPIDVSHLADAMHADLDGGALAAPARRRGRGDDEEIRAQVVAALERCRGNVSAVAAHLGKSRMQIHRWARRFGLDLTSYRRTP